MKNLTRKICLIFIFLILFLHVSAQTNNQTFISSDGGFSINLPEKPLEERTTEDEQAYYLGYGKTFTWGSFDSVKYAIDYIKLDTYEKPLTAKRKTEILADAVKRQLYALTDRKPMTKEKDIVFNGSAGKEVEAIFPTGKMLVRTYLIGKKLYMLYVAIYNLDYADEAIAALNSFRILSKEEIVAQKLKETTIAPLPQAPVAKKLKSDAEDKNLKGKVKSVVEYEQKNAKAAREPYSEEYYNEQGNLIKEISYIKGYPFELKVWGYIDGSRVNNEEHFDYNGDESELLGIIQTVTLQTGQVEEKPRDERYTHKYQYKYDAQGNLVELSMYLNNGDLWMRYVYALKGNVKETEGYDEDGKLNSRSVETLDKNGNVIEDSAFDSEGKLYGQWTYTYTLDNQGNWIMRRSFKKTKVKGKPVLKPDSISYRTITYY